MKADLTDKQLAQREKDCKVRYGRAVTVTGNAAVESLVPQRCFKALDKERAEKWIPEEVVLGIQNGYKLDKWAFPQWKPTLKPVIAYVLDRETEMVAKFMKTPSQERITLVGKVNGLVTKELFLVNRTADPEIVASLLWRMLFDLQKDQGVNLMAEIRKMVKV